MPPEVFELAAGQLKEFPKKIKLVSLSGHGEPLCNPDIADMVRLLEDLAVTEQIDMHTNASLLTEESAVRIAKAGFTRIVVSLQGLDAAAYERTCGVKIDFQQLYNNLKLMYESKDKYLKIHIKMIDTALDPDDPEESERRFYEIFDSLADDLFIEKAVPIWTNLGAAAVTTNKYEDTFGEVDYCPLLFYKMLVAPDGGIYPCTNIPPPMSLGNIRDISLREVWNSRRRLDFLKEHLNLTRHNHTSCRGCFVPVNTVMSQKDVIDPYRDVILERLEEISPDE